MPAFKLHHSTSSDDWKHLIQTPNIKVAPKPDWSGFPEGTQSHGHLGSLLQPGVGRTSARVSVMGCSSRSCRYLLMQMLSNNILVVFRDQLPIVHTVRREWISSWCPGSPEPVLHGACNAVEITPKGRAAVLMKSSRKPCGSLGSPAPYCECAEALTFYPPLSAHTLSEQGCRAECFPKPSTENEGFRWEEDMGKWSLHGQYWIWKGRFDRGCSYTGNVSPRQC